KKIGKNLTYKEIEQKLEEWNKQGYVHQLIFFPSPDYFYIICACHPDYCLTLSNMKKWGFPAVVKADFVSTWNESQCEDCGTCVSRCYFGAIIQGDQGGIEHDASKCVGCGLCVTTCPSGAFKLDRRVKYP
ncbi:hypothetical protein GF325_12150, partial [Candidatus Bathyarchaeota archaeon]|nr:hypothetical protein [Candidatus Bathyarchaeota archaeon]